MPPDCSNATQALLSAVITPSMGSVDEIALPCPPEPRVGSAITTHWHWDLLVVILIAAVCGAVGAVIVGMPALRIRGLFLAVTTFAFAVTTGSYFLRSDVVHFLPNASDHIERRALWGRLPLDSGNTPQVGLYLNDATAAKIEYYLDYSANIRSASSQSARER